MVFPHMDVLLDLLKTLNSLSPLAVIALLGVVIYKLVGGNKSLTSISEDSSSKLNEIATNHLHELPDMAETLRRIESQQTAAFAKMITLLENTRLPLRRLDG